MQIEIEKLKEIGIPKEQIWINEPMKKHTTIQIGGLAEYFIKIKTVKQLKSILCYATENKIPITVIGNGSNILVSDEGIEGITLQIQIEGIELQNQGNKIEVKVGAGVKLGMLAQKMLQQEITGLEELSGIPGTIGGAVVMNAGAHGKEMKDIVTYVKCVDYQGKEKKFLLEQLEFEYRTSIFKKEEYIITEIGLQFIRGKKEEIKQKMEEYTKYRKEKQPIEYPSAGSTFKRGTDFITAKLIDEAGLKGYCIGDAEVSTKHSGFIINKGNATAKDVLQLVDAIRKIIKQKFDKNIELEIEIIGKHEKERN